MRDRAEYSKGYRLANKEKLAEQKKAQYLANKEKVLEQKKAHYLANKDKRLEQIKDWGAANKDKVTDIKHKSRYGITLTECTSQFGTSCNICGYTPVEGERGLCTDHCHGSNVIRGRLCSNCNRGLGMLGDTLEDLESAVRYLQRSERYAR